MDYETAARFGCAYIPEPSDDPLTVRDVLRDTADIFGLTVLLCGMTAIVAVLGFGIGS